MYHYSVHLILMYHYSVHLILMYHYSVISYAARNGKAVRIQE